MSMSSQLKDFWVGTYFRNALLLGHPYLTFFFLGFWERKEKEPPTLMTQLFVYI
jgi:hypothetical protein